MTDAGSRLKAVSPTTHIDIRKQPLRRFGHLNAIAEYFSQL